MAKAKSGTNRKTNNGANLGFETQLWAAADKLRGIMEPFPGGSRTLLEDNSRTKMDAL